jgi:hypothetical protein
MRENEGIPLISCKNRLTFLIDALWGEEVHYGKNNK